MSPTNRSQMFAMFCVYFLYNALGVCGCWRQDCPYIARGASSSSFGTLWTAAHPENAVKKTKGIRAHFLKKEITLEDKEILMTIRLKVGAMYDSNDPNEPDNTSNPKNPYPYLTLIGETPPLREDWRQWCVPPATCINVYNLFLGLVGKSAGSVSRLWSLDKSRISIRICKMVQCAHSC